ncbi:MAG: glycosyltransferase family 2 protein [Parvularculaceae bacterium]
MPHSERVAAIDATASDEFVDAPARPQPGLKVAVLLPCYNEALTVGATARDMRAALADWSPDVYVYDNNSSDDSVAAASAAGAIVRAEPRQGKGNVMRRMFADVDADVYVLLDADGTYDPASAPAMVRKLIDERLDMVVGARLQSFDAAAFRRGHQFGNRLLTSAVRVLFGKSVTDMLSGYRVFSRRFVKSFPALSSGFETETELTVHALRLRMPIAEIETPYGSRPEGSASKLNTIRDGMRILSTIVRFFQKERPLRFFSAIGAALGLASLGLAAPVFFEFAETGLVPRFPTAILAASVMVLAFLSAFCGVILDTVTHGRDEMRRLLYLSIPAPGEPRAPSGVAEHERALETLRAVARLSGGL